MGQVCCQSKDVAFSRGFSRKVAKDDRESDSVISGSQYDLQINVKDSMQLSYFKELS